MKKSRFSEEQIIGILKGEQDRGPKWGRVSPRNGIGDEDGGCLPPSRDL